MDEMPRYTSVKLSIFDRVEWDGGVFRVRPSKDGRSYIFTEVHGAGQIEKFSYAQIARLVRNRAIVIRKGYYTEEELDKRKKKLLDPDIIPEHVRFRARMITKFLEEQKQGLRSRSDESILEFYDDYMEEFEKHLPKARGGNKKVVIETHHPCTPRHFMRLVKIFEDGSYSSFSLMYGGDPSEKTSRKSTLSARTNAYIDAEARKLATSKRTEIATRWQLMTIENSHSADPVVLPDIRTFYRRVAKIKKMLIHLGQLGAEATRNEFELSKTANRQYHPLERIEMDEDKLDIILLLKKTRLWNVLHPDVQKRLEVQKDRFWASVAIDAGTRSILALRLLDGDPNGRSGVATLHMAVMPKDHIAEAAGTENKWIQFGIPQEVATDHGAAYLDTEFHDTVLALSGSHLMPPTGNPKLRGRIERFFRTGKKWLRLFTGQTFSNPLVRANYDSVANASMEFEEFARCLIRLIVDVYHITPHDGLGGQKPIDAWAKMTKARPVDTLTDPEKEGMIFGFRAGKRKISRSGVVCLGIPYYDDTIQHLYNEFKNQEVVIRANPYNLGLLGVRSVRDDAFHFVKAAVPAFDGVSAIEWAATKRLLNESYSQYDIEDEAIIGRALTQIQGTAKFSEDKLNVSGHVVTEDDYDYFEREYFAGYVAGRRSMPDYAPDPERLIVDELPSETHGAEDGEDTTRPALPDVTEAEAGDDDDVSTSLGPSEGTFDPGVFARRRAEDGVAAPLSIPPPKPSPKPREEKDKPVREVTISELLRGTTDLLPKSSEDKQRTAGRVRTFKSDWEDEEDDDPIQD